MDVGWEQDAGDAGPHLQVRAQPSAQEDAEFQGPSSISWSHLLGGRFRQI
jgi:hypothetical protein